MENIKFEAVLVESAKLPMVKIDRELFLRKELRDRYSQETVEKAIQYNPAYAGICVEDINKIAKSCITAETTKVTALSAAAGLPGGFIMIGTVPADLAQYFGHILRILQKLIYLYGWHDLSLDSKEMNEETKNLLTLFVGIMFGVNGAVNTVNKLAAQVAKQVVKKTPTESPNKRSNISYSKKGGYYIRCSNDKANLCKRSCKSCSCFRCCRIWWVDFCYF